ncbi:MAG: hypothetical protein ACI4SG_00340 [Oligosphaeraceae bacterium]
MPKHTGKTIRPLRLPFAILLLAILATYPVCAFAADTDNDGLDDVLEMEYGFTVGQITHAVYLDAVNGNDENNGLSSSTAKKTFAGAQAVQRNASHENVIIVAPGIYSGAQNRGIDFQGEDIKIRSTEGPQDTIVDLEGEGRFLHLHSGETTDSRVDGLTIRNGYAASYGAAIYIDGASLDIRNCILKDNQSGRLFRYENGDGTFSEYWQDGISSAAIYAEDGSVILSDCRFEGNESAPMAPLHHSLFFNAM